MVALYGRKALLESEMWYSQMECARRLEYVKDARRSKPMPNFTYHFEIENALEGLPFTSIRTPTQAAGLISRLQNLVTCPPIQWIVTAGRIRSVHQTDINMYKVFHFEVSISAPRLDLGSKSQQILTLARARSIWDFEPPGANARAMPVDFSEARDVKPVR
jgi:hypothetical protein